MKRFLPLFYSFLLILSIFFYLSFRVFGFFKPFIPFTNYLLGIDKPITYLILLGNDTEIRANGGFAGSYTKITLSPPVIPTEPSRAEESPSIKSVISGTDPESNPTPPVIPDLIGNLNKFSKSNPSLNVSFQDIYVPNGQLQGHVTPPDPIQQAFGHGTWELANADWEPDFPTAAKDIRWFLEKGKEINPDILGIVNLTTIKKVLDVVGDFSVPEYKAQITPDNLYLFLQGKTEVGFFPGSTQKKDTLTAVGTAMIKKLKILPISKKIKIAKILYEDLSNQNIVANSLNPSFQNLLIEQKFAGAFSPAAFDNYALIETNLGANKANQFVTRSTTHKITVIQGTDPEANPTPPVIPTEVEADGTRRGKSQTTITSPVIPGSDPESSPTPPVIPDSPLAPDLDTGDSTSIYLNKYVHHQVTVKFINSSPEANPNPPLYYGGDYITYLRIYIPTIAQNVILTRNPLGLPPLPSSTPSLQTKYNTVIPGTDLESRKITQSPSLLIGNQQSPIITTDQILDKNIDNSEPNTNNLSLTSPKYGFTEIGFWHTTPAGGESSISLSYDLPLPPCHSCVGRRCRVVSAWNQLNNTIPCNYSLAILKQNGMQSSPQTIDLFGKTYSTRLETRFFIQK